MGRRKKKHKRESPAVVRDRCDVAEVLSRLGMEVEEGRSPDELYALCPSPDHGDGRGDRHIGTFSIHDDPGDERHGMAHCWSCKWGGDIFDVVRLVTGCGFDEALEFVAGGATPVADVEESPVQEEDPEIYWRDLKEWRSPGVKMPRGCVPVGPGTRAERYLAERLFGSVLAREEGILDWRRAKRIVVPVRMYGKLVTWVARSYNGVKPKTITPELEDVGSGSRWAIGGYDEAEAGGVLNTTESWANRLRLKQAGWSNPLSLCGSDLTEERVLAIMALKPEKIVHWIDGDAAGRRLARDIADVVGTRIAYDVVPFEDDKDVANYRPSEVRNMKPVAWSDHKQVPTRERS
jgi:hypothetical protein